MEKFTEYTNSWSRPASLEPSAGFNVPWSGEHDPPSGSMPAAVAGRVAQTFGEIWHEFHDALLRAYFVDHRTISDVDVLADVAESVGIDRDDFLTRFAEMSNEFARAAIDDHNDAINANISGVPAVVFDNKYLVSGAVDLDHYHQVLAQVRAERAEQAQPAADG